jgi:hypothetical protein
MLNCRICNKPLVNIESGISRYFTYICTNPNCIEFGKVQNQRDTAVSLAEQRRVAEDLIRDIRSFKNKE